MFTSKWAIVLIVAMIAAAALAGCASATPTAAPPTAAPTAVPPTSAPAAGAAPTSAESSESGPPVPNCSVSDCTKTGPAITQNLKGDVTAGEKVFADNCAKCHGDQGKVGIDNPGSTDGTVPSLNPIDPGFSTKDPTAFAAQIDAFVEHGSTPDGTSPKNVMDAWGDSGKLTPQQIADVISYVMSLNK
ncbi:MAG: c-type cytochrome [Chloroflexi bacterium]|nr:c-type cytochrome [Chloroflexota bacterium]